MGIGPTEPKGAYSSSAFLIALYFPFSQLGIDIERTGLEIDSGIAFLEMQGRGNLSMLQRQQKFQNTRYASSGCSMPYVGLDRSNSAELLLVRIFAESTSEGSVFYRVSHYGPRAMPFNDLNCFRIDFETVI